LLDNDTLKRLYDVSNICNAVVKHDAESAVRLFDEQSDFLVYHKNPNIELMHIFLNSLDRGIYNSILFAFGCVFDECSLRQCCYQNCRLINKCKSCEHFNEAGKEIIHNYCKIFPCHVCKNSIYIEKAKEYIENNIGEPLNLEEVANNIFISKSYLSHLFKTCAGISFSDFVLQQRIGKAKALLLSTESTVTEIALTCGFSQANYFATAFKKNTTYTPSQYRANFPARDVLQ